MLNDIIKLNDTKFCFVSPTTDKENLNIVIFNLYNNDNVLFIKYYIINFFSTYSIKFYQDIRIFSYNDFISLAFSYCNQSQCSESRDLHYSSLIIFNYPNSPDESIDLIHYLYTENERIEGFIFNIENKVSYTIENNIFGYQYVRIKILNYPDNINLFYAENSNSISKNTTLENNKNLKISFESNILYKKMNYTIEYAVCLKEPSYTQIITPNDTQTVKSGFTSFSESTYNSQAYFTGKTSFFNIIINENLTTECNENCYLCYENNINFCITCKYNYTFNNSEKTCFSPPIMSSLLESTIIETTKSTIIQNEYSTLIKSTNPLISNIISKSSLIQTTNPFISSTILKTYSTILYESSSEIISSLISTSPSTNNNILLSSTLLIKSSLINSEFTTMISFMDKTSSLSEYSSNIENSNDLKCTKKIILEGKCNDIISYEEIEEIYNELTNEYILKNKTNNTIIITKNALFQLSTIENQKYNSLDISSIDFGECEKEIKRKEGLSEKDELIILKLDLKNKDLSSTYVQYEVYNPFTLERINMEICLNYGININIPVNFDPNIDLLYNSLNESGYNLFYSKDSFYNDDCSIYTSLNGTDVTLTDRKNIIYNNNANISLCQEGSNFQYYNSSTKKINCECPSQKENIKTNIDEKLFNNGIYKEFFASFKKSNFFVMKCYKLLFSLEGQKNNIGSYIMISIGFLIIILMIFYCINGEKKIKEFIKIIIKKKISLINKGIISDLKPLKEDKLNRKIKKEKIKEKIKEKTKKDKPNIQEVEAISEESNIKILKFKNLEKIIKNNKKTSKKTKSNFPPKNKKSNSINIISFSRNYLKRDSNNKSSSSKMSKLLNSQTKINTKKSKINLSKNEIYIFYNDEELNTLTYENAIKIDHRTYCQYYFSLLKKKHLMLFTFLKANDYNLFCIKLSLFFIFFSLSLTINAFFSPIKL